MIVGGMYHNNGNTRTSIGQPAVKQNGFRDVPLYVAFRNSTNQTEQADCIWTRQHLPQDIQCPTPGTFEVVQNGLADVHILEAV